MDDSESEIEQTARQHIKLGRNRETVHVSVSAPAANAISTAHTVTIQSTTHFWLLWSEIAISHLQIARHHRETGLKVWREKPDQSHLFARALGDETRAAMVAVSAAAHAIDAFYGACKPFITLPLDTEVRLKTSDTPRRSRIFETLKVGFAIGNRAKSWPPDFQWLFGVRDAAVHFDEKLLDLADHPTGTMTSIENVTYSLESADRAVVLMLDVLATCSAHPKPHQGEALVSYAGRMVEAVTRLQASYQDSAVP